MKTGIIFNPAAGSSSGSSLDALKQEFPGRSFEIVQTAGPGGGLDAARALLGMGTREIWVLGGDGTLSEVAQVWLGELRSEAEQAVWGLVPTGRGNDFFRGLLWADQGARPPSDSLRGQAIARLKSGRTSQIDLVKLDFLDAQQSSLGSRIWLNVASGGYGGEVVRRVVHPSALSRWLKPILKRGIYLYETVAGGATFKPEEVALRIEGEDVFMGRWNTLFVLNGRCNGGGMCWSRTARPDDGRLNFTLLEWTGPIPNPGWAFAMWSGDWAHVQKARMWVGNDFEIERKSPPQGRLFWDLDGDCPEPVEWKICRGKPLQGAMTFIF